MESLKDFDFAEFLKGLIDSLTVFFVIAVFGFGFDFISWRLPARLAVLIASLHVYVLMLEGVRFNGFDE